MENGTWNVESTLAPTEMSEASRLLAFLRPETAMRDIVARPTCFAPLMLVVLAIAAYSAVAMPRSQWAANGPATLAWIVAGGLIRVLLMAVMVFLLAAVLERSAVSFNQVLAVVCYARIPGVLFAVLAIFLIVLRRYSGLPDSRPLNPLLTNLAIFLDPRTTSTFVYSLATSVDVVFFWMLSLVAIGLKATSRISSKTAATTVVVYWAVYSLGIAAWQQSIARTYLR